MERKWLLQVDHTDQESFETGILRLPANTLAMGLPELP